MRESKKENTEADEQNDGTKKGMPNQRKRMFVMGRLSPPGNSSASLGFPRHRFDEADQLTGGQHHPTPRY